ncbi:struthiocalcin-1-like isoform X2 [Gambusia affinis]|uniref:struthiocalcin-1-like isoform X2 n=1 Tax=Gambusia affinis TaxID=33528 RepID=UPI001CDD0FFF|nr:struthiocalcin-1-like isoform X2 [Gambusia affinis]
MMNIFIFVPLMLVLHFICGDQPPLREGNITFHDEHKTLAEAQAYCRTHHTDLITSGEKTDLPSNYKGWIGLHIVWKWSSGGNCNYKLGFLCYDERLVLVKENKTWEEALEHCRTMKEGKNYTLATLNTIDDHNFAREKAQLATSEEVWTGLRYLGDEWFWVGGGPVQYQGIPRCPAERCGVLEKNSDSSFGIRDCNERRNFFCYLKS